MQANPFAILENKNKIAHTYLCYGDFNESKELFEKTLEKSDIRLNSAGHYIFTEESFGVDDARNLVKWYNSGQTSNDDAYTIAVIASGVIKKDAQQMLLKILEEAHSPYVFFIFAKPGTEIIETIISRSQIINIGFTGNKDINKFIKLPVGEKIKKVTLDIKGMESSGIREYTESLLRELMFYYNQNKEDNLDKLKLLNNIQKTLSDSYIAPKFILDYMIVML